MRSLLTNCHYLENSGVHLCGLHLWGSPFSNRRHGKKSSNSAFQYNENIQRSVWRFVPNSVDVLMTHGPSTSSPLLRAALERVRPLLHAHGHEHELHGATLQWPPPPPPPPRQPRGADGREPSAGSRPPHNRRQQHPPQGEGEGEGEGRQAPQQQGGMPHRERQPQQHQQHPQHHPHQQHQQRQLHDQHQRGPPNGPRERIGGGSGSYGQSATLLRPSLVTVNAAICNKQYQPIQLPIVVDLPKPVVHHARPTPRGAERQAATRPNRPRSTHAAGERWRRPPRPGRGAGTVSNRRGAGPSGGRGRGMGRTAAREAQQSSPQADGRDRRPPRSAPVDADDRKL